MLFGRGSENWGHLVPRGPRNRQESFHYPPSLHPQASHSVNDDDDDDIIIIIITTTTTTTTTTTNNNNNNKNNNNNNSNNNNIFFNNNNSNNDKNNNGGDDKSFESSFFNPKVEKWYAILFCIQYSHRKYSINRVESSQDMTQPIMYT